MRLPQYLTGPYCQERATRRSWPRRLAQAPASHHDALPARKSAGVAEAARVTAKVEGVDPPRVVHDFTECAALEDSVPLEDFAADLLHVGFPKLQDPPPLDPPSEQGRVRRSFWTPARMLQKA